MLGKIIKGLNRIKAKPSFKVAVHIRSTAIGLVEQKHDKTIRSSAADYVGDNWQQPLQSLLSGVSAGSRLHIVLAPEFYQLVQLDKPVLSDAEMLQALPWQVKDLVTISPEDIIADYIDLPGNSTQQAKVNVVVASMSWLKQLVREVEHSGLQLASIQPEEWLASQLLSPSTQATMLVIHQPDQEVLIQIVRDGLLYFSRRTRGFSNLHLNSEAELRDGILDRLQLELQRSMDYFESQLKQPPVRDIRVLMTQSELMCSLLKQGGFNRVEILAALPQASSLSTQQLVDCWPAVAALNAERTEPAK